MNMDTSHNLAASASPTLELDEDGMLPEYDFDYSKAKPNPYAGKITSCSKSVTLAPDVAAVFTDSEAVNAALRTLIDIARASVSPLPASAEPPA